MNWRTMISSFGITMQFGAKPLFEKVSVKGGEQHPLYQWLQSKTGKKPDWNFAKYLVSEDGKTVTFFSSSVEPLDDKLVQSF